MNAIPIPTCIINPSDDLWGVLKEHLPQKIEEESILVISSKVVALCQDRISQKFLEELVREEAEEILSHPAENLFMTVKNGILIANAGIDASNVPGSGYVLWPQSPFKTAATLQKQIQDHWKLSRLGIVISDSRVTPRRRGTVGVAVAWSGFSGVEDRRGEKDLFDRVLRISTVNMADNLASCAEVLMGQGAECTPLVLISGAPIRWTDEIQTAEKYAISREEDVFPPFS
ncbi:MAG: coenzyme F420-0:L-glutamate ligase [Candidatus Peregrinibacteria bacterium]